MTNPLRTELEAAGAQMTDPAPLPKASPPTPTSHKCRELPDAVFDSIDKFQKTVEADCRGEKGPHDVAEAKRDLVLMIREGIPALVDSARYANDILTACGRLESKLKHIRDAAESGAQKTLANESLGVLDMITEKANLVLGVEL